jgi:hypothetical protein
MVSIPTMYRLRRRRRHTLSFIVCSFRSFSSHPNENTNILFLFISFCRLTICIICSSEIPLFSKNFQFENFDNCCSYLKITLNTLLDSEQCQVQSIFQLSFISFNIVGEEWKQLGEIKGLVLI